MPGPIEDGPYPTVVEYSGYGASRPDSPQPGSRIAGFLDFATVGVNMRGTGCSGGVFDVFNPAQHADGYDVIEAVAAQPWVANNSVGMVGLSYAGISQLYVAATQPPSLAAITPLSVIDGPWREQWPGGVYNDGFTKQWLAERDRQAQAGGQSWDAKRIAAGDTVCADNQRIRSQNLDFEKFGRAGELPGRARGPIPPALGATNQRAGLPVGRVPGRADRRALRLPARQVHVGAGDPVQAVQRPSPRRLQPDGDHRLARLPLLLREAPDSQGVRPGELLLPGGVRGGVRDPSRVRAQPVRSVPARRLRRCPRCLRGRAAGTGAGGVRCRHQPAGSHRRADPLGIRLVPAERRRRLHLVPGRGRRPAVVAPHGGRLRPVHPRRRRRVDRDDHGRELHLPAARVGAQRRVEPGAGGQPAGLRHRTAER
ncbi:MAG: CocE/NonD family hydrolase [Microthrixaceae bacterium]